MGIGLTLPKGRSESVACESKEVNPLGFSPPPPPHPPPSRSPARRQVGHPPWMALRPSPRMASTLPRMTDTASIRDLLDFWFLPLGDPGHGKKRDIWWESTPELDAEIRGRFAGLLDK